ncbi:MAG: prenyltransferase [Spirochaetes bacterium]|nr:prenyltransferase [Spirochaetota bacterium]
MTRRETMRIWLVQIRSNFLALAVLLTALGLALAALDLKREGMLDGFSALNAFLVILGVVLAHVSVNLFNEYSDHKTGIDSATVRTPFSGGTGMIQSGKTTPVAVSTAAWQTLFMAFLIGLYFAIMSHWIILVIMAVGGASIVLYTRHFARVLLGEFFAGLSLGSLVVIGTYVAMTAIPGADPGTLFPTRVILIAIPPGILTSLLLFLNEFPDAEADRAGGRFHLVIFLGKRRAAYLYVVGLLAVYASIIILPVLGYFSWISLLGLLTMPLAAKAAVTALRHAEDTPQLVPALGLNVIVVLATDLLLTIAVVLEIMGVA